MRANTTAVAVIVAVPLVDVDEIDEPIEEADNNVTARDFLFK